MTLSAIHNGALIGAFTFTVVCDIGGYDFVSYSQLISSKCSSDNCCL